MGSSLRIVNGSLFELLNATRESAGLAALKPDEKTQAFMTMSVLSLSDSFFYPAPVLLELTDFKQVQQSVFQVARAPGKVLVYIGAVLLIVGVFAMLYIRERRLWVWIAPLPGDNGPGGTKVSVAMSTTTSKCSPTLNGWCASLPNETASPPSCHHQHISVSQQHWR